MRYFGSASVFLIGCILGKIVNKTFAKHVEDIAVRGRMSSGVKRRARGKGKHGKNRGRVCDPVGVYDVNYRCEAYGELVGPLTEVQEISDRGDGFYNLVSQFPFDPPILFNFTVTPVPDEENMYRGALSWTNSYPGPLDETNYPPEHLAPLISAKMEFDDDCNYWLELMVKRPDSGLGVHPCHTKGVRRGRRGQQPEDPFEDGPLYRNTPFLGNYEAEITCFVGTDGPFYFFEEHEITRIPASEGSFFRLTRTRDYGYMAIDVLSQNGMNRRTFHGATQNITDWNMEPGDPAYFDETLVPIVETEIVFHRGWDSYEAVLIGQRPGIGEGGYPNHVCRMIATRSGQERVEPTSHEYCNPAGAYNGHMICKRHLESLGEYQNDNRVEDLGHGFYRVTLLRYSSFLPDELFVWQSLVVEHPTKPGSFLGATYYRNDYTIRVWDTTDYPVYVTLQIHFDGASDGRCEHWMASFQGYRPGPEQGNRFDSVHFCTLDATPQQYGALVQRGCEQGTLTIPGCGVCYETNVDYLTRCVGNLGIAGRPSFPAQAQIPDPVVLPGLRCADIGYTDEFFCPDDYYDLYNDVCVWIVPGHDQTENFAAIAAANYFTGTMRGYPWLGDFPECEYIPPETPEAPFPTKCFVPGRYSCPAEYCVNGADVVLDGTAFERQLMIIEELGNGFFDVSVRMNPLGVYWNATMKQLRWEPLMLKGAMHNRSITTDVAPYLAHSQLLELHFNPNTGCSYDMILTSVASMEEESGVPVYVCEYTCTRIRGESPLAEVDY